MSQFNFGVMDPYVVDGVQLADSLNQWRDALHSMHRGPSRPAYAVPGQMWISDAAGASSWVVNAYMGPTAGDVPLFTYNTTTGATIIQATSIDVVVADFSGAITGTSATFSGTVTANVFSGADLRGGIGGGGWLRGYNNANAIGFKWDGLVPWINIDNSTQLGLTTQVNARLLNFYTPAGGPTTWGLGARNTAGTISYTIFADAAASDERIKENIAPTEVDALEVLQQIPITKFDIKADAAAFLRDPVDPVIGEPQHIAIGIVAQQIGQHIPDADVIVPQPEGSLLPHDLHVLNNGATLPYLIRAIQQLAARIAALEAKP